MSENEPTNPLPQRRTDWARRRCIFCGVTGKMSSEHVFPEWLQKIFPPTQPRTHHIVTRVENGVTVVAPGAQAMTGDMASRRLDVVCKPCNNGWMSRLQTTAEPLITKLVLGEPVRMTREAQAIVAAWTTMTAMVWEFADEATIAIAEGLRFLFRESVQAPGEFTVWIGTFEGAMDSHVVRHTGFSIAESQDAVNGPHMSVTTFTIGKAIFHAICQGYIQYSDYLFEDPDYGVALGLAQIWEPEHELVEMPGRILSVEDAQAVSDLFLKKFTGEGMCPPAWNRGPVAHWRGPASLLPQAPAERSDP